MRNPDNREHQNKKTDDFTERDQHDFTEDTTTPVRQEIVIDETVLAKTHSRKSILNWLNNLNFWHD